MVFFFFFFVFSLNTRLKNVFFQYHIDSVRLKVVNTNSSVAALDQRVYNPKVPNIQVFSHLFHSKDQHILLFSVPVQ